MKLIGRGSTTCLICNKLRLFITDNMPIVMGVKLLYEDTDEYNIMLMASKICIKCAGRLHQLFDFNLLKTNLDLSRRIEINSKSCHFCDAPDVMDGNLLKEANSAVADTKWIKDYRPSSEAPEDYLTAYCCLSCYNFLLLYCKIETFLIRERLQFYTKIKTCLVVISRDEVTKYFEKETSPLPIEGDSELNDLQLRATSEPATLKRRFSKVVNHTETEDVAIENIEIIANTDQNNSINPGESQVTNVEQEKILTRGKRNTLLSRLSVDINSNKCIPYQDKFSAIKLRRSSSRPNTPTPISAKKRKVEHQVEKPPFAVELLSDASVNENITMGLMQLDVEESEKESLEVAVKIEKEFVNEVVQITKVLENPQIQQESLISSLTNAAPQNDSNIPATLQNEDELSQFLAQALYAEPSNQSEPPQVTLATTAAFEELSKLTTSDDFDDMIETPQEHSLFTLVENSINLEMCKTDAEQILEEEFSADKDSTGDEAEISSTNRADKFNLKEISISLTRMDDKIKLIVGERMPKSMKVSKSGRKSKPKLIHDPTENHKEGKIKRYLTKRTRERQLKFVEKVRKSDSKKADKEKLKADKEKSKAEKKKSKAEKEKSKAEKEKFKADQAKSRADKTLKNPGDDKLQNVSSNEGKRSRRSVSALIEKIIKVKKRPESSNVVKNTKSIITPYRSKNKPRQKFIEPPNNVFEPQILLEVPDDFPGGENLSVDYADLCDNQFVENYHARFYTNHPSPLQLESLPELKTEIEFLAPCHKNKGKIILKRKLSIGRSMFWE